MAQLRFFSIHRFEVAGPVLVCDTKHFPRKGCRHMRIQNWGWTHIQLTGKENVSMYYCTVLCCTTILLHTLFTLVLYLSMYTRTHPKHTRGTNPFSAISPCITFLVIVVGLVTNSLLYYTTCIQASDVMPIPFRAYYVGRLFDFVWSRLLPFRLTLLYYSRRYTRALGTLP